MKYYIECITFDNNKQETVGWHLWRKGDTNSIIDVLMLLVETLEGYGQILIRKIENNLYECREKFHLHYFRIGNYEGISSDITWIPIGQIITVEVLKSGLSFIWSMTPIDWNLGLLK